MQQHKLVASVKCYSFSTCNSTLGLKSAAVLMEKMQALTGQVVAEIAVIALLHRSQLDKRLGPVRAQPLNCTHGCDIKATIGCKQRGRHLDGAGVAAKAAGMSGMLQSLS